MCSRRARARGSLGLETTKRLRRRRRREAITWWWGRVCVCKVVYNRGTLWSLCISGTIRLYYTARGYVGDDGVFGLHRRLQKWVFHVNARERVTECVCIYACPACVVYFQFFCFSIVMRTSVAGASQCAGLENRNSGVRCKNGCARFWSLRLLLLLR